MFSLPLHFLHSDPYSASFEKRFNPVISPFPKAFFLHSPGDKALDPEPIAPPLPWFPLMFAVSEPLMALAKLPFPNSLPWKILIS